MEKNKRYSLIVGLLIFIIVLLLGVCVAFGLGVINTNKGDAINNSSNAQNGAVKEEVKVEEKVEYRPIVETAMEKVAEKTVKEDCEGNTITKIDIKAPKINIDTENVKKVNEEILKYANEDISEYNERESAMIHDVNMKYTYKYDSSVNALLLTLEQFYSTSCATGGYKLNTYLYDIKKDKFLTPMDLGITDKELKEEAYRKIAHRAEEQYFEDSIEESVKMDKENLDECISAKTYKIVDIVKQYGHTTITVYFPIDLDGLEVMYVVE